MSANRVIVLGAGPAGLGAAWQLARRGAFEVTVLERNTWVGGNAASFDLAGMRVDFGSHRLHPACDPEVLADIRSLLGDDLRERPRHGRIRLQGRWIHFPLKPVDLALRLPPAFALGVAGDMLGRPFNRHASNGGGQQEDFASVMERGLGGTICRDFYFPYARKIWGLPPQELSALQARRRVSAGSLAKMARKVLSAVPGFKAPGFGVFYYPRHGYGQISDAYYQAARQAGVNFFLGARVAQVELPPKGEAAVHFEFNGESIRVSAGNVWSTIPITSLARMLTPAPPAEILVAAENIDYRAMLLVYLVVERDRFSEFDAHYFPGETIPITRLSEPKNYFGREDLDGFTVLCAELPCSPGDEYWQMEDADLGLLVQDSLERSGIPLPISPREVLVRRLRHAYPIYRRGYELHFDRLVAWLEQFDHLLTFGRQGLFAHDNTHHALYMAYSAVKCLNADGTLDRQRWAGYRKIFSTHVVED